MLFVTESAVLPGHPQLSERRHLAASELTAFGVMTNLGVQGTLPGGPEVPSALLRSHSDRIDARLERVISQQYLRLAVVRRDAKFEMAGVSGRLVLSGGALVGSTGRQSLRPIRVRVILWAIGLIVLLVASMVFLSRRHALAYFARANEQVGALVFLGLALSIPALGTLLRELRPRFKFGRLVTFEKVLVAAAAACFLLAVTIRQLAHPRVAEIERALAANNVTRARYVLDALLAGSNREAEVVAAQDRVELAEAALQPLDAKLDLLDRIAARKGRQSDEAARLARAERLAVISNALDANAPGSAINALVRWFSHDASADAEVRELRAKAEQQVLAACPDTSCRFGAATRAKAAAPSPQRASQLAEMKQALLTSVQFGEVPNESVPARLGRLRQLAATAAAARSVALDDTEIATAAERASAFAQRERSQVALLGAGEEAVAELVGPLRKKTASISYAEHDAQKTFVVFDAQRRCRGLYVVGSERKSRDVANDFAVSVLSQSIGRPATLKPPTGTGAAAATSRWIERGVAVVARWSGSTLIELRIGDAAP